MSEYKVIRVGKNYDQIIKNLLAKSEIASEKEYTEAMLTYFEQTGIGPKHKIKSVSNELKKLRDVMVSFTRQQEKTKLDPIMSQMDELTSTLLNYLKKEAIKKSDLIELLKSNNNNNKSQAIPENRKAKELFEEFITKMNSKVGGGTPSIKKQ